VCTLLGKQGIPNALVQWLRHWTDGSCESCVLLLHGCRGHARTSGLPDVSGVSIAKAHGAYLCLSLLGNQTKRFVPPQQSRSHQDLQQRAPSRAYCCPVSVCQQASSCSPRPKSTTKMTVKKPRNSLYKKGSKARANELKFAELKGRMAARQQRCGLLPHSPAKVHTWQPPARNALKRISLELVCKP
jgi:hypothetical protein